MNERKDGFSKFFSKLSSNSTHPESAPLFDEEPPDSSPLPLAAHEDQSVQDQADQPFEEAVPLEDELADLLESID